MNGQRDLSESNPWGTGAWNVAQAATKDQTVLGARYTTGTLKGKNVVLTHSGIGKANAAMAATVLLYEAMRQRAFAQSLRVSSQE